MKVVWWIALGALTPATLVAQDSTRKVTELRGFLTKDLIFPLHASSGFSTHDGFIVTSLALTL